VLDGTYIFHYFYLTLCHLHALLVQNLKKIIWGGGVVESWDIVMVYYKMKKEK